MQHFEEQEIPGVYVAQSFYYRDDRGSLSKCFENTAFLEHGISFQSSETFFSTSCKYVLRGMHFQLRNPQAKLISVVRGCVFDVVVDLRSESATFGKWTGLSLTSENRNCLYIPRGCAHGFVSLQDDSIVSYQCDGAYDKETDTGIIFDDDTVGIRWPISDRSRLIISERDRNLMTFQTFQNTCSFYFSETV